jgi:hypothetical protein
MEYVGCNMGVDACNSGVWWRRRRLLRIVLHQEEFGGQGCARAQSGGAGRLFFGGLSSRHPSAAQQRLPVVVHAGGCRRWAYVVRLWHGAAVGLSSMALVATGPRVFTAVGAMPGVATQSVPFAWTGVVVREIV